MARRTFHERADRISHLLGSLSAEIHSDNAATADLTLSRVLDNIAICASITSAQVAFRDRGADACTKIAAKRRTAVRKALGYTYPKR